MKLVTVLIKGKVHWQCCTRKSAAMHIKAANAFLPVDARLAPFCQDWPFTSYSFSFPLSSVLKCGIAWGLLLMTGKTYSGHSQVRDLRVASQDWCENTFLHLFCVLFGTVLPQGILYCNEKWTEDSVSPCSVVWYASGWFQVPLSYAIQL